MLNTANINARAHRAGHAAMLADGHRGEWQPTVEATFVATTSVKFYVTNPKGNRAWGPPSA